jgi:hypothetical protein
MKEEINMEEKRALWNSQLKVLKGILLKQGNFDEAMKLFLEVHAMLHSSEMSSTSNITFEDELWEGLDEVSFRTMPTKKDETIAWSLWHITRIEDITMNILVSGEDQVINQKNWFQKMKVNVKDTGNAMTDEEIIDLSSSINMQELRNYRMAVGRRTLEIIQAMKPFDMKRKMEVSRLKHILDEGAVLNVEGANWLIDFWGNKNVAGILMMPVTRHQLVHINEAMRLKQKCQSINAKRKAF